MECPSESYMIMLHKVDKAQKASLCYCNMILSYHLLLEVLKENRGVLETLACLLIEVTQA